MGYKPQWLQGIFPALITPFTAGGALDEAAYRRLIRHLLPHVHGIVPIGTTGEFSSLSREEKEQAIAIAIDEVAGRVPVIAGTGCPSTRETVALTRFASEAGAQAALIVAPYYLKPAFNEVYEHYEAVDKVGLPFLLYNIPQCAGTHFRWWTAEGMAAFEYVIGIKDSSGDQPFLMSLLEKIKGKIAIFCGNDEIVTAALAAGADGAILASANLIPDIWQDIYRSIQAGNIARAQDWQARIQKLVRIVVNQGSVQAVKEGLRMMGLEMGDARLPSMPADAFRREDWEELRVQLEDLGKIVRQPVEYALHGRLIQTMIPAIPQTPRYVDGFALKVGEGFSGPPLYELAHIDLVLGERDGPVDRAIDQALVAENAAQLRLIRERPRTLLVPKITVRTTRQAENIYQWATQGVLRAIDASVADGFLPEEGLGELAMIANVFVHPSASNRTRIDLNNYKAMRAAIRKAIEGRPSVTELLKEKEAARHPFRYEP